MTASSPSLLQRLKRLSLVTQILIGLIAGIALALFAPEVAKSTAHRQSVCLCAESGRTDPGVRAGHGVDCQP